MASNKKQSFLHGAALLAGATAIVKVLGALYKIPLGNIIDDAGFGYFNKMCIRDRSTTGWATFWYRRPKFP